MKTLDHGKLVKAALDAVLAGATIAERSVGGPPDSLKNSLRDIVTATDIAVSELLVKKLGSTGFPVLSEERPHDDQPSGDIFWVVDPIDGSVNFAHGLALFAVSAGLVVRDEFSLGVVCAPGLNELYFTLHPEKSLFNGRPFRHDHRCVDEALLAASFAARGSRAQYALFHQLNETTRGCLRTGSAAINICWAAAGRLQAAYGFGARLWDVAGALAVARSAGCALAVRQRRASLSIDYCVGSRDVVQHVVRGAAALGLWD